MPANKRQLPEVKRLFDRSNALGLSLRGLSVATDISHSMFVRWRSGETTPSLGHYLTWLRTVEKLEKGTK